MLIPEPSGTTSANNAVKQTTADNNLLIELPWPSVATTVFTLVTITECLSTGLDDQGEEIVFVVL